MVTKHSTSAPWKTKHSEVVRQNTETLGQLIRGKYHYLKSFFFLAVNKTEQQHADVDEETGQCSQWRPRHFKRGFTWVKVWMWSASAWWSWTSALFLCRYIHTAAAALTPHWFYLVSTKSPGKMLAFCTSANHGYTTFVRYYVADMLKLLLTCG